MKKLVRMAIAMAAAEKSQAPSATQPSDPGNSPESSDAESAPSIAASISD
jgi:hypothetical protein